MLPPRQRISVRNPSTVRCARVRRAATYRRKYTANNFVPSSSTCSEKPARGPSPWLGHESRMAKGNDGARDAEREMQPQIGRASRASVRHSGLDRHRGAFGRAVRARTAVRLRDRNRKVPAEERETATPYVEVLARPRRSEFPRF